MRKARLKKDKETTTAITEPPPESLDEIAASPAPAQPTQHHHGAHDEGICR